MRSYAGVNKVKFILFIIHDLQANLNEHNARSGGTPAAPREKDLVWRLVAGGVG